MKTLVLLLSLFPVASAFTVPARLAAATNAQRAKSFEPVQIQHNNPLSMASDGSKKRRKRKDGKQFAPPAAAEAEVMTEVEDKPAAPVEPKENTVVMQVQDIRNVVSGVDPTAIDEDDDELGPDEEWEYYDEEEDDEDTEPSSAMKTSRMQDESLEQLLADARKMRSTSKPIEEKEKTMSDTIFEVISTIVTIDFFVVIGLLVWFLVGIFCSSVLKDDTVQIAFNMNFEKLTQPALGILMIGSVAGALGKKEEQEE